MTDLPRQHEKARRVAAANLKATSEANRPVLAMLQDDLLNRAKSWNTVEAYTHILRRLDQHLQGRPLASVTAFEIRAFLASIRSPSVRTMRTHALSLSAALPFAFGGFHDSPLPADIRKALRAPKLPPVRDRVILTDEDLRALLTAAQERPRKFLSVAWTEQAQALVWMLWASGFRIDELLSLNVSDVVLEEDGAWLALDQDAAIKGKGALKTKARRIYVAEGVAVLKAWMALHPLGAQGDAPLFMLPSDSSGRTRMSYNCVQKYILKRLERLSGILLGKPPGFHLHPHLFRHSCATRKARLGWNEAQMRSYFGWSKDSREPATYIHLAASDMRDRVRRDLGLDVAGQVTTAETAALEDRIARVLRQLMGNAERPPR